MHSDIDGEQCNSIAEFVADPASHYREADGKLSVSGKQFAAYYRGDIDVGGVMPDAKADGRTKELLELFDRYEKAPMYPYSFR